MTLADFASRIYGHQRDCYKVNWLVELESEGKLMTVNNSKENKDSNLKVMKITEIRSNDSSDVDSEDSQVNKQFNFDENYIRGKCKRDKKSKEEILRDFHKSKHMTFSMTKPLIEKSNIKIPDKTINATSSQT